MFGGGGWARVAGNVAGDDLGGRRSSGVVEPDATGHGEACGEVRCALRDAVK